MRKLRRSILKARVGSNNIRNTWRYMQLQRYGVNEYYDILSNCGEKGIINEFNIKRGK